MKLFVANIKSNPLMRQSRVESDIEHAIHLGGVGFWQEIAPKRYKATLARHAEKLGHRVHGISVECPLTLRHASWIVESEHLHPMHPGRLFVTPRRWTLEVRGYQRTGAHLKTAFYATHFLSSAWSTRHMLTRPWRRRMWFLHRSKLRTLISQARQDGYNVLVGLDANRNLHDLDLHPQARVIAVHGVLGIIAVPAAGMRVRHDPDRVLKGLFTDHDPVAVGAIFEPIT